MHSSATIRTERIAFRRRAANATALLASGVAAILVLTPLIAIFGYLVYRGVGSLSWNFLTKAPVPVGETGGGMGNAIVGSGEILLIASLFGVPLGIGGGIFLAEFGRNRFGNAVRF